MQPRYVVTKGFFGKGSRDGSFLKSSTDFAAGTGGFAFLVRGSFFLMKYDKTVGVIKSMLTNNASDEQRVVASKMHKTFAKKSTANAMSVYGVKTDSRVCRVDQNITAILRISILNAGLSSSNLQELQLSQC